MKLFLKILVIGVVEVVKLVVWAFTFGFVITSLALAAQYLWNNTVVLHYVLGTIIIFGPVLLIGYTKYKDLKEAKRRGNKAKFYFDI